MPKRLQIPKPLFDTLEQIKLTPNSVSNYLKTIPISETSADFKITQEFLLNYTGSRDTYNAYRREVERLLHWTWLVPQKSLKKIDRNDLREYLEFINNPPLSWIGLKTVSRFYDHLGERIQNPEWHPYVVRVSKSLRRFGKKPDKTNYQVSNQTIQALFSVLSTYFTYLQQEEYVTVNPVALIRQKKRYIQKTQTQKVTRKLSRTQWLYTVETAEKMAQNDPKHERSLFLITAFYLLGLRISEVSETPGRIPRMGDFAPDKNSLWWFSTIGKGNKLRDVAVPDEMLEALKRFRKHLNLTPLPYRGESTPLIPKERGKGGLGARQVRNLIQTCFDNAIYRLEQEDLTDEAQDLATATVHWLRHTAISTDVEDRPREHVRDDVGHESAITTDRYIDIDRVARHQSAKNKKLKPE